MGIILDKLGEQNARVGDAGTCLLSCLPPEVIAKVQSELLAKKIAAKLAESMGAGMEAQVAEQGIALEARGCVPAEEGAFLLRALSKAPPEPAEELA